MSRGSLLSLAALGAILAGCSPSAPVASVATSTSATNAPVTNAPAENAVANTENAVASNSGGTIGTTATTNAPPVSASSVFPEPEAPVTLKRGQAMLPFKMVSTKGETITNASLKGKVVLLDFWATWCGPCKKASPTMEKLSKTYGKDGLVVIGANTGEEPGNAEGAAAGYAKEHGYTYTFTKKNDALSNQIGNEGIPFFVIIDRDGKVSEAVTGFDPDQSPPLFEKRVKELLAQSA